jgi:hypothetical protein
MNRARLISEVFLVEMCAVIQHSNLRIGAQDQPESHRTLRDGSIEVAVSQALRARLRSHCPSGTFGEQSSPYSATPELLQLLNSVSHNHFAPGNFALSAIFLVR